MRWRSNQLRQPNGSKYKEKKWDSFSVRFALRRFKFTITTHSPFVKAQKRNLILIIFYRKIQTLGVKNTTLVIEMVIFGAWMIQRGNLRKLVSNKHAKLDHQLWLVQQNNEAFCVYESVCASVDRGRQWEWKFLSRALLVTWSFSYQKYASPFPVVILRAHTD